MTQKNNNFNHVNLVIGIACLSNSSSGQITIKWPSPTLQRQTGLAPDGLLRYK